MNRHITSFAAIAFFALAHVSSALADDDPALLKDLTSVIALLGLPCGKVIAATRLGENDHLATCENGTRYRVYVNAEGRVVAQKQ
jgi:hypothetical protein